MPWNVDANRPIARALYRRLIVERAPSVQVISRRTGIPESTLRGWADGISQVPGWALPVIAGVVGDPAFFAEITGAGEAGFLVLPMPPAEATRDGLQSTALEANACCGAVGASVSEATRGRERIDTANFSTLTAQIDATQRVLESVRREARELHRRKCTDNT